MGKFMGLGVFFELVMNRRGLGHGNSVNISELNERFCDQRFPYGNPDRHSSRHLYTDLVQVFVLDDLDYGIEFVVGAFDQQFLLYQLFHGSGIPDGIGGCFPVGIDRTARSQEVPPKYLTTTNRTWVRS